MLVQIMNGRYSGQQILLNDFVIRNAHPPVSAGVSSAIIYMGDCQIGEYPLLQFPKDVPMPEGVDPGDFFEIMICNQQSMN